MTQMTDEQVEAAKYNLEEAKASMACEGIYLTEEEEAMFKGFIEQRLSHDECHRRLMDYSRAKRAEAHTLAAE